jgi:MFS family permease
MTINLGWVLAPFISGLLVSDGGFSRLYTFGSMIIFGAFLFLSTTLKGFKDDIYARIPPKTAFRELLNIQPLRTITTINFILQFFYAWMVIYVPIYLTQTIGFSWETLGIILTVMLVPFIITQFPVGLLLDRGWSVRRIIQIGFLITIGATLSLVYLRTPHIVLWAAALFCTRVGVSIVEAVAEIYFFKHTDASNAHLLGVFRNMTPLAYILAPIIGTMLFFFGFSTITLFILLAILMCLGIIIAQNLKPVTLYEKTN